MSHYFHFTDKETEAQRVRGTGQSHSLIKGRGVRIQRQAAWLLTTAPHSLSRPQEGCSRTRNENKQGPTLQAKGELVGKEGAGAYRPPRESGGVRAAWHVHT